MPSSLKQKYYEDIINTMPGHVYWKDKDGVFLGCNLEQARDAGYNSPEELIGKTDYEMPWSIQADYLREIDKKVMASGRVMSVEELFELPDGTKRIYLSKKLPLFDDSGQVSGILGISFDITDRKKLEEDLVKAKNRAEAANHAKTEFLENMRHDIRTPLTGMVGFSEIIKKESTEPQVKEYADNLIAASHMLLEFLNEILEAIKVLTTDVPLVRRKFCLNDVVNKVLLLLLPKSIEKKIDLGNFYDNRLPKFFVGDPARIQRVLLELLTNALNFTNSGSVKVNVELAERQDRELVVKFTVSDTGIGIPEDKVDEVFLRFNRLSPSYKGIYKGAGLGLAIAKKFIDDIGGEIYCESKVGKGSVFTCLVPLHEALLDDAEGAINVDEIKLERTHFKKPRKPKNGTSKSEQDIEHASVLIVEDQDLAAKAAKSVVVELDCDVDIASSGTNALELIEKNHYDLIFMDIGLPDTNGHDLTKEIRSREWKLDQHIPIIALTAHIDDENKQKCLEYGMDAVLSKPLSYDTARDIINAFIPVRHSKKGKQETNGTKIESNSPLEIQGDAIDIVMGAKILNSSTDVAKKMIHLFIVEFQNDLPDLISAKNADDWKKIQSLVHKHRGSSLYCGIPRMQIAMQRLDELLISNKTELRTEMLQVAINELDRLIEESSSLK